MAALDDRVLPPDEQSHYERRYEEIDDLVLMEDGSSVGDISGVLSKRYESGNIYTSVGPVLVAINPYRVIHRKGAAEERSMYDDAVAMHYYRRYAH